MDEQRLSVYRRLLFYIFAASLLQVSREEDRPRLNVAFGGDDFNDITLECSGQTSQAATFTFINPLLNYSDIITRRQVPPFIFPIEPENETVVSCGLDGSSVDSERVAITALPQYTTASAITQYTFSDSNMTELECPLPLGRLHGIISPYDFSWSVRVLGDPNRLPIPVPVNRSDINGSVGIFHFKDSLNRQLQVHIPSPVQNATYSFRCDGQIQRCNETGNTACTTRTTESPFITMELVDPVVITSNLSNKSVTQNEEASFTCTAVANEGELKIKWEVDGELYNTENCTNLCSQVETDNSSSNSKTSTLIINTRNIMSQVTNVTYLNIVCIVNHTLKGSLDEVRAIEFRPASPLSRLRSETAQLLVFPAHTTPPSPPTTPPTSGTTQPQGPNLQLQPRDIYIITGVFACVILIVIIILSLCIVCIFRYHYKNKKSQLGRRLRRTFSKDPEAVLRRYERRDPSPIQLEAQHFQGTDTPPILYTDTNTQVVNGNHLLGPNDQQQIYNYSQNSGISGVSSYSGLSGVSQNNGPHHMPHFKEPSLVYQDGNLVSVHLGVPPNTNGAIVFTDGPGNGSRRASDASGSVHSGHSAGHQQQMYIPTAIHGSHNIISSQQQQYGHQHQHSGGPESTSLPRMIYMPYTAPSHSSLEHHPQQPLDTQPSLPILPTVNSHVSYPQLAASQPLMSQPLMSQPLMSQPLMSQPPMSQLPMRDRTHSMNSSHSNQLSTASSQGQHSQHQSPHMQPVSYNGGGVPIPLQPHFISRNDLATVELALMHNKNCQIPGCCCYRVKEIMENRGYRHAPYDSPEMGSICSSGSGNSSSRAQRIGHQPSSTDSDSDYGSSSDRRSRPLNLRLLSDEHNRNPNLHPHYHLTTKSYLRRVSVRAPVDHRRSKSLSDLTPLTEVPETPAKTPAIGGIIKQDTPVYNCQPALGGEFTDETNIDDCTCPSGHPALLREISISADNIPALCLNDCPFTPSPLKEGRHPLASSPGRLRRKGSSFKRGSIRNARPNLKTLKEKTSSDETDGSNTSSRADSPVKSSVSDDEMITDSKQGLPPPERGPSPRRRRSASAAQESSLANTSLQYDSSCDDEVQGILQNTSSKDVHNMSSSHSPLPNRNTDSINNTSHLLMSDTRLRRSTSPLSIGSCSQVSSHSRRSNSPYETEVRKQNGIITEITEC